MATSSGWHVVSVDLCTAWPDVQLERRLCTGPETWLVEMAPITSPNASPRDFRSFGCWKHLKKHLEMENRIWVASANRDFRWLGVTLTACGHYGLGFTNVWLIMIWSPSDPERPRRSRAPVPDIHFAATCISTGTSEQPRSLGALTRWPRREARTQQQ